MIMYWLDSLFYFISFYSKKPIPKKHIAFVRLSAGIGDWITLLPSIVLLRSEFPKSKYTIFAIVDEQWAPAVELNGNIDYVVPVNRKKYGKNILYRVKINFYIKNLFIDKIFDFALFRRLSIGDSIVRASGASIRIGYMPQPDQPNELRIGDSLFTTLIEDTKWEEHEIIRSARLLSLNQHHITTTNWTPRLELNTSSKKNKQFLCCPGASVNARKWDPKKFAEVAKHIYLKTGWQPILVGSKADYAAIAAVLAQSSSLPWEVHDGSLGLLEYINLVSASNFIICNDSGPMHIGPAVQTYTVAIVPGAEFTAYSRYPSPNNFLKVVHSDSSCFNCRWNCKYEWNNQTEAPCVEFVDAHAVTGCVDEVIHLIGANAMRETQSTIYIRNDIEA